MNPFVSEVVEEGRQIPPFDPLIYNSYPSYIWYNDDPNSRLTKSFYGKDLLGETKYRLHGGKVAPTLSYGISPGILPKIITSFTGKDLIQKNWPEVQKWIIAFGLNNLSFYWGCYYLRKIQDSGALYQKMLPWPDMFWRKYFNREKPPKFSLVQAYLIGCNPFERTPLKIYSSYFQEGFNSGRILGMFGYLIPLTYQKPIKLKYAGSNQILSPAEAQKLHPIILQRLYFQIKASEGFIDMKPWNWLLTMKFNYKTLPEPKLGNLVEEVIYPCLICLKYYPSEDFPWCGHGNCKFCQMKSGSAKCVFCNEHFVCSSLNDSDVESLTNENQIESRVLEVKTIANSRPVAFDFINQNYHW